jgi:hypothetical protein
MVFILIVKNNRKASAGEGLKWQYVFAAGVGAALRKEY